MKIQNRHLKALLSVCENDKIREYVNQICVNKSMAYASNGYIGIRAVVGNDTNDRKAFKASTVKLEAAVQESNLKWGNNPADLKTALITLDNVQPEERQYPPIETSYEVAEEQKNKIAASYDLDHLISLLQAIKKSCTQKTRAVTLHIGDVNKPMLITIGESGVTGIIVPSRF